MTTSSSSPARRVRSRRVPRQPMPSDRLIAVGAALMQDLCERGESTPESVANLLAMPGEALQRYLRSQKLRFPGIAEDVRLIRAFALLRAGGADAERIAVKYGFRSNDSLERAFQRRFGCLPSANTDDGPDSTFGAAQRVREWRERGATVAASELRDAFDALDAVECNEMLGAWRGGGFDTGHPAMRQLHKARWAGKTFHAVDNVDPLVCRADDGSLYADHKTMGGGASLQMIEYRGKVSSAMVYDARPVIDHFRRVDDVTLLGVMTGKSTLHDGQPFYFYLQRDKG